MTVKVKLIGLAKERTHVADGVVFSNGNRMKVVMDLSPVKDERDLADVRVYNFDRVEWYEVNP